MSYSDEHLRDLRAVKASTVAAALGIKGLKRKGHEHVGPCPRCGGTDRFSVDDKKNVFNCRQCETGGDVIELVRFHVGCDFVNAVEHIEQIGGFRSGKGNGKTNGHAGPNGHKEPKTERKARRAVAWYDYRDEDGKLLYQVVRYEPKDFRQRRPGAVEGTWVWGLGDLAPTLYHLPELVADMKLPRDEQSRWFLCEGEKDVDNLAAKGLYATTNSGGARNFGREHAEYFQDALDVILLEDADDAGAARAAVIAPMLLDAGARVRVLRIADYEPKGAKDISEWFEHGGNENRLYDITSELKDWEPPPYKSPYGARTFANLSAPVTAYPWRVKGLIPASDSTLFMGPSRSGKTFAVLDLAMHVALGREKYVEHVIVPGGVAYLSYEGQAGFENRVRAYAKYHGLSNDELRHFAWWVEPPGLFGDGKAAEALAADIKACTEKWALPLAAIVIDTHNSATRGSSEIKSEDISKVLDCYDVITKATGAPLWIIGHTNDEGRHRGNQQIFNRIEATLYVDRIVDGKGSNAVERRDSLGRIMRRMKVEKQREGLDYIQWEFVLNKITLGYDSDGDEITSMVACEPRLTTIAEESSAPKGAWKLSVYQAKFMRALLQGQSTHGVPPPSDLTYGDGRPAHLGTQERVVSFADVSTICRDNEPVDETDEEAKKQRNWAVKKALTRARDDLQAHDIIKVAKGGGETKRHYVWPTGRAVAGHGISWPPPRVSEAPPEDDREVLF